MKNCLRLQACAIFLATVATATEPFALRQGKRDESSRQRFLIRGAASRQRHGISSPFQGLTEYIKAFQVGVEERTQNVVEDIKSVFPENYETPSGTYEGFRPIFPEGYSPDGNEYEDKFIPIFPESREKVVPASSAP